MIYPKISRKYLAFIVLCLLLTLCAVGVSLLIYYFNENRLPLLLTPAKAKTDRHNIIYEKRTELNKDVQADKDFVSNESNADIKMNERKSKLELLKHRPMLSILNHMSDNDENDDDMSVPEKEMEKEDEYTEQQNIYIDEFDKPNVQNGLPTNNVAMDFFGTEDYSSTELSNINNKSSNSVNNSVSNNNNNNNNNNNKNNNNNNLEPPKKNGRNPSLTDFNQSIKTHKTAKNEERLYSNLDRLYDTSIIAAESDDEDDNEGDDLVGSSGSGDFTWNSPYTHSRTPYDEDTADFIKRISLKMLNKYDNKPEEAQSNNLRSHKPIKQHRLKQKLLNEVLKQKQQRNNRNNKKIWRLNSVNHLHLTNLTAPKDMLKQNISGILQTEVLPDASFIDIETKQRHSPLMHAAPSSSATRSTYVKQQLQQIEKSPAWLETRTRRIIGNVKKSEERSRQLLLCEKEEAGGGELCRMLFKGHLNQ